jgi:hypothetical protein
VSVLDRSLNSLYGHRIIAPERFFGRVLHAFNESQHVLLKVDTTIIGQEMNWPRNELAKK